MHNGFGFILRMKQSPKGTQRWIIYRL